MMVMLVFGRWFRGNRRLKLWTETTIRLFSASNK
jgi:hypothetical protein